MPPPLPHEAAPSLGELVRVRAGLAPAAPALLAPGRPPLRSADLRAQVEEVAGRLGSMGIGPGEAVAVVLENGPELAAAFLGVASVAACAPLNPAYRRDELRFALADLDARALVVERDAAPAARAAAAELGVPLLELSPRPEDGAGAFSLSEGSGPAARPRRRLAGDVALLLHTSGTTARPKLVPLTHGNLCPAARNLADLLRLTGDDRCLNAMPLFHIHGLVASVLASLHTGGAVVCAPGFSARAFLRLLEEEEPTWYTAVPTMHQALLAAASELGRAPVTSLRLVRSCSAALPLPVIEGLERLYGCPAIEAYGMTEAALPLTSNPLPPALRKPGSVGLPVGVALAVLGAGGEALPAGELGEVAVRGPTIFGGYVENEEANHAAFTGGWFRTGDLGSLDEDGYLWLRGRSKELINRAGEKVSPREVDDVLLRHPAVAEAAAFALPHPTLGEEVAAAVVARPGHRASERELQAFAAASLADFKVPRLVAFVEELPKGPTGKVQRIGLAERLGIALEERVSADDGEPATPLEGELCTLAAELLERERVGAGDDLFELGLDSLSATALVTSIGERGLGPPDLPAATLLFAPTVRELAAVLDGAEPPPGGAGLLLPLGPAGERESLFLVAPHDGTVMRFTRLARSLASGHQLVGVGAEPDADGSIGLRSVEEIGAAYAAAIREAQPTGPYYLGGYCLGGGIALETARVLLDAGEEVAALLLLDPIGERQRFLRDAWRRARALHGQGGLRGGLRRLARDRLRRVLRRRRAAARPAPPPAVRRFRVEMELMGRRYAAEPYAGRVTVLASPAYGTPERFWRDLAAGGAAFHRLPRFAGRMLRSELAADLARLIDDALERAERAA